MLCNYPMIGLMSGTSLDGLDMAYVNFVLDTATQQWSFEILSIRELSYDIVWVNRLRQSIDFSAVDLLSLHQQYGTWLGEQVLAFKKDYGISSKIPIASHGHTIFHQPNTKKITFQLGHGQYLANASKSRVICDFRTQDVALGGQGAPLVPIGDALLFHQYDYCVNLGGIANLSYYDVLRDKRIAYDITVANMVFNSLAEHMGCSYDRGGEIAKSGICNKVLFDRLNSLAYYHVSGPKSLGIEWFKSVFLPILNSTQDTVVNKMRTVLEHSVFQLSKCIIQIYMDGDIYRNSSVNPLKILVTGGGAKNTYYISRLKEELDKGVFEIVIPSTTLIDYKEALIFAFLGVLRDLNLPNCLSSVTGANKDHSSGVLYYPCS